MNPVNKLTGLVIAVLAVLMLAVGSASANVAARTLTVGSASGNVGADVLVPITIDDPSGVGGISFTITYDPAVLTFLWLAQATSGWTVKDPETFKADAPIVDNVQYYNPYRKEAPYADRTYTTAANATLFYQFNDVKDGGNNPVGMVLVSGASAEPLTGTTLFAARFQIKNTAVGGVTYPIQIFRSIINNPAAGYSTDTTIPALVGMGGVAGAVFPVLPATLVAGGITVAAASYGGSAGSGGSGSGGCFIATAAYGSYFDKHVEILRNFRDAHLLTNDWGRSFVGFYYRHSPALANFIAKNDGVRAVVRLGLAPVVAVAYVTIHTTPFQKVLILLFLIGVLTAGLAVISRIRGTRRIAG